MSQCALVCKKVAQEGDCTQREKDILDRNGMEFVMREEKPQQNNITIKGKRFD